MRKEYPWGWTLRHGGGDVDCEIGGWIGFGEDWPLEAKERWLDLAYILAVFNQHYTEIKPTSLWGSAQPSVHAWGMSMVRLCCRQERWKQHPVIPALPMLPPTDLKRETFSATQTITMAKMGCIVSKNWKKHPYFYTRWFTWRSSCNPAAVEFPTRRAAMHIIFQATESFVWEFP